MRHYLSIGFKITVSVIGLLFVLSEISLGEIWAAMRTAQIGWLLVAFGLMVSSLVVRSYRWRVLLEGVGVTVSFGRLITLYLIGNFFNAFLLSGLGGDVVRAIESTKDVSADIATGTVIVDRMTGLLMLFAMALLALPFRPATFPEFWFWIILCVATIGLIGGFAILEGTLIRFFGRYIHQINSTFWPLRILRDKIWPIFERVQGFKWATIGKALLVSGLFNLMLTGWWFATAQALQLDISYRYCLLVVPIMSLALLVPSVGGLGVRETLAPSLFIGAGVESTLAYVLVMTVFILLRLSSLLGLPLYLRLGMRSRP